MQNVFILSFQYSLNRYFILASDVLEREPSVAVPCRFVEQLPNLAVDDNEIGAISSGRNSVLVVN